MKRFISLILISLAAVFTVSSQMKLEFKDFKEDIMDFTARAHPRVDANGDTTALLKIQIPLLTDALISSPQLVGGQDYVPGEFHVYLSNGSKQVTIKHSDFEPFTYNFPTVLKGKNTYKLVLKVPEEYLSTGQLSVKFFTNVVNASLNIDNRTYTTDDGEFLIRLKKGDYHYTVTADSNNGFKPYEGNLVVTADDIRELGRMDIFVELPTEKKSNLHIEMADGSTVKIDGKPVDVKKGKAVTLPIGRHYVEIELLGYSRNYTVDLNKDNEYLNGDISVPFTVAYPSVAEFTVIPKGNALKPSSAKLKAGQTVRLLGTYNIEVKAKDYEPSTFEYVAQPKSDNTGRIKAQLVAKASQLYTGTTGVAQNSSKARQQFENAVKKGDETAMWNYGKLLAEEDPNSARARMLIMQAADAGYPDACIYAAAYYVNDDAAKEKYLLKALQTDNQEAVHLLLGNLYAKNRKTAEKALDEYSKYRSEPSFIGSANLLLAYPELYNNNRGYVITDLETLTPDYEYYPYAQRFLGDFAYLGIGMNKDITKATEYWAQSRPDVLGEDENIIMAAKNNNDLEKAFIYLNHVDLDKINKDGVIYNGVTVIDLLKRIGTFSLREKRDVKTGFRLMEKIYAMGDRSQATLSNLGKAYKDGEGVVKDMKKAKMYLRESVEKYRDPKDIRWLGLIYEAENDYDNAERCYLYGVEAGDDFSKGYYATLLYKKGKDYFDEAEKLWTEAAQAGHKQSMKNLVTFYEKVKKNPQKAGYWKNKSK